MKLLIDLLGSTNAEHIRAMQELSQEHELVYWTRIEDLVPLDKSLFPRTVFHNYLDATRGIAAKEVDASGFEPWSRGDIMALCQWETELLSMMDKAHGDWPVNKRKDFYYELLRYWGGVLDRFAPDIIVFNAPPHQVYNFALFAIAKERGIRTLMFDVTFRQDRLIFSEDYRLGNATLAEAQQHGYGDTPVSIGDLPQYMQAYYRTLSETADPTPAYLTEFKRATVPAKNLRRRMSSLMPYVRDGSIFERGARRFFKLFKPSLADIYHRLERAPDLDMPYVYAALHYQPECTTSPQAGIYVDQLLLIKTLAAALPAGWKLYVKEHPAQWPAHWGDFTPQRYEGFYEEIARIPNVSIVPITTSTFVLSDRARATATASGTAAWESVLRGKCALIFGYPWFMHAPGIFRVSSEADCRAAFEKIQNGQVPDKTQLFKYLKVLSEVVFPGSIDPSTSRVGDATDDEQWKRMYEVVKSALLA